MYHPKTVLAWNYYKRMLSLASVPLYAVILQKCKATGCLSLVIAILVGIALFLKREDRG